MTPFGREQEKWIIGRIIWTDSPGRSLWRQNNQKPLKDHSNGIPQKSQPSSDKVP